MVRVLFFGRLGELAGAAETVVDLPSAEMAIEAFRDHIARSNPELANELGKSSVRAAINQEIVFTGAILRSGDEVAFLPPVSGG